MREIIKIMISTFQQTKESGSYALFYFLALGLGLAVAWDRYSKTKIEDNWMLEEAKKKIQLWPFLYGLCAMMLVVANPLAILMFHKLTPIAGQYYKVWGILLFLFLSAYGVVCFLGLLRDRTQKVILIGAFAVICGLAGSGYGILADRVGTSGYKEEKIVAQWILEKDEDALVLATDKILEYVGVYEPQISVLYGKDIYTANMDLGILDSYSPELMQLYESMKHPENAMGEISNVAYLFHCDVIVVKAFENAPDKAGVYYKREMTDNFIIYMR